MAYIVEYSIDKGKTWGRVSLPKFKDKGAAETAMKIVNSGGPGGGLPADVLMRVSEYRPKGKASKKNVPA